jgi:AAA domain
VRTYTDEEARAFGDTAAAPELVVEIDRVQDFAQVDEAGANALLGDADNALIPEGGDVMIFGTGGSGKTTLIVDCAMHLGSGRDWLGIPVQRVARVLLIENEGPRALMRRKLRRRLEAWDGPQSEIRVLRSPWATMTLASEEWRIALAHAIDEHEIDVVVAGPLSRIGMEEAGTLQQTRDFMRLVDDVRSRCRTRRPAWAIVHHENRAGTVSGAWEGAGDTLLHVRQAGPGHTVVHVAKARWASEYHGRTLKLAWTPGGGFETEAERDLFLEVEELLSEGDWRTVEEIRQAVKAGTQSVREVLEDDARSERFEMRTGEQSRSLGRSSRAQLYGMRS